MKVGFFVVALFFLGLILGSFANVLIDRRQKGESLSGRSKCDQCGYQLRWFDNIPVLSFLFLQGYCRKCKQKINRQYPLVELGMALLFGFVGWWVLKNESEYNFIFWQFNFLLTTIFLFLVIFIWDIKYLIIPNRLIVVGLVVAVLWKVYIFKKEVFGIWDWENILWQGTFGALVVGGLFYGLWFFSKGRWIGGGDVKLGVWLGFLVGWRWTYFFLLIAYLSGAIVALILLVTKQKRMSSRIPFGPFLIFSAIIILFWQQELLAFYHKFLLNFLND